jgi:hypothetical protein
MISMRVLNRLAISGWEILKLRRRSRKNEPIWAATVVLCGTPLAYDGTACDGAAA